MKWMELRIVVPEDEGFDLLRHCEADGLHQLDEDWCTHKREFDRATIDYSPCDEPPDRKEGW